MVLSKRNASGEFVVWKSASQASKDSNHGHEQPPPFKRQRVSSQNLESTSSISRALQNDHNAAKSSPSSSFASNTPETFNTNINTPRLSSPDLQVVSSNSNKSAPYFANVSSPMTAPHKPTPISSQTSAPPYTASSASHAPAKRGRAKAAPSPALNVSVPPSSSLPQLSGSTSAFQLPSSDPPVPPVKRGRGGRKKATDASLPAPKPEKRGAIFKKKCPQNILDRVERVMTQRIFMIDRNRVDGELKEEFSVLGSTGNVYTVTIDHRPRCSCPDSSKGNHCKHILFIFLKVLQVTQASGYWYQKALLTTELQDVFAHAPLAPNSMAHPHVREAYARATGKATPDVANTAATKKKRVPGPDDDCPICYDGMHGAAEASLVFCEDCGNALHKECFGQWQRTATSSGKDLTCVWCRAPWVLPYAGAAGAAVPGARRAEGGYLNLGAVGGASPVRDTTTYYHGPRRGHRYYGYQQYAD
ncbi:hypothetical protein HYPSUDRAFT_38918 [Hypholoma sublateritium FD-334 SS-4]|uniref:SWIM-type domain-containing protein n=1 Tax=Hypholoma sublateritium (strain FD-334 SS-4) TaxID=945553 RepID=A0A0D2NZS3_HYPSF|nr:hypothetical protein HYPSUDRAFT_38918 [Hypholoma sublateritium FD-334 SS-4]